MEKIEEIRCQLQGLMMNMQTALKRIKHDKYNKRSRNPMK